MTLPPDHQDPPGSGAAERQILLVGRTAVAYRSRSQRRQILERAPRERPTPRTALGALCRFARDNDGVTQPNAEPIGLPAGFQKSARACDLRRSVARHDRSSWLYACSIRSSLDFLDSLTLLSRASASKNIERLLSCGFVQVHSPLLAHPVSHRVLPCRGAHVNDWAGRSAGRQTPPGLGRRLHRRSPWPHRSQVRSRCPRRRRPASQHEPPPVCAGRRWTRPRP